MGKLKNALPEGYDFDNPKRTPIRFDVKLMEYVLI